MQLDENGSLGVVSAIDPHPQLDATEILLRRTWICQVPILEEPQREVPLSEQTYTEVIILAVHWAEDVGSPVDYCLIAVPELAAI
eukprot:3812321-Amphidinium_carterae.1